MALIIFHGDKGGVGKSAVCKAFVNWGIEEGYPIQIVDSDTRNPDVHRMFEGFSSPKKINLKTNDGWADLLDLCAENLSSANVALNLPAGSGDEDEKHKDVFMEATSQIGIPVILFWVIDLGVDSVNQLRQQLDNGVAKGMTRMICVRNQHFAPGSESFNKWNGSKTRQTFESNKGVTIDFPNLSTRVVTQLDSSNLPYSKALGAEGALGAWDSVTLKRWVMQTSELFSALNLPLVGTPKKSTDKPKAA